MRISIAALLVAVGLAVVAMVVTDDTGQDIGVVAEDQLAQPVDTDASPDADDTTIDRTEEQPSEAAAPSPSPSASPSPRRAAPAIGRSSARIADVQAERPAAPTSITIAAAGVDARVVPVAGDADDLMEVPDDVSEVGWYRFGAAPASPAGSIVLAGHVDSRTQGRGAFFALLDLEVDDEVVVTDDDGVTTRWRVTGRRTYDKESLPVDALYAREGPPRLVLITCGGDFDADNRSYRSNVVVEAVAA